MPLSTIGTNQIADGAVAVADIADGSVTTAKLADNAVTTAKITDANITTAKVANDAITTAKVNPAQTDITSVGSLSGLTVSSGTVNMSSSLLQFSGNISLPNVGACIFRPSADTIAFGINNGQRISVNQHGLLFGTDTASANALDDYEEGTWTPTLLGSSSNPTVSYNQTSASYIKIGQSVHLHGRILATSVSGGSGTALIGGLPFATSGSYRNAGTIGYISNVSLGTGYTQFGLNPDAGTSTMRLVQSGSGVGANVISVGVIANNFDLTFSHSYTV